MRNRAGRGFALLAIHACGAACVCARESTPAPGSAPHTQSMLTGELSLHYVGTEVWGSGGADPWGTELDVFELFNGTARTWTYRAFDCDGPLRTCMSLWRNAEWQPWCDRERNWPICVTGARRWTLEPGEQILIRQTSSGQPSIAEVWLTSEDGAAECEVASEPYIPPERVIDGVSNRSRELRTIPRRELDDPLSRIDWCRLLASGL